MKVFKSIGIIGGGTAGYLTALTLKKAFPNCSINLVESSDIPPIGVGESTTPKLLKLLHHELGFDISDFFKEVNPTVKLGGKLYWGSEKHQSYNNAFGYIDPVSSLFLKDNININSLNSLLMDENKVFIVSGNNKETYKAINEPHSFSYHLDNHTFIKFLQTKSKERGIKNYRRTINKVILNKVGEIDKLLTNEGEHLKFDFYMDCTGFNSTLLSQSMKVPYITYDNQLLTDSAITAEIENNSIIKPYTTSSNMQFGWEWNIPMHTHDHLGYVYSSNHTNQEKIIEEWQKKHVSLKILNTLKFKSGRHQKAIIKNTAAIGNAYGFIEALHSTSLHMCINNIYATVTHLKLLEKGIDRSDSINKELAKIWDSLKDFISMHFKLNHRINGSFWNDCNEIKISNELEFLIESFRSQGLLFNSKDKDLSLKALNKHMIFGLFSYDFMLEVLGLKGFKNNKPNNDDLEAAKKNIQKWSFLTSHAINHKQALSLIHLGKVEIDIQFNKLRFLNRNFNSTEINELIKNIR
ncbi:tryptophan 7-halogenase [bacterium]|nr:tryptophan 7-halogenase [bacterium]